MSVPTEAAESADTPSCDDGDFAPPSLLRRIAAWGVHLFTASGAVFCLLTIDAGVESRWRAAFAWLAIAVCIDAVDGFLARWVRVSEVLPGFDGAQLDNLVDYASYVLVPAFLMHRAALLPPQTSMWIAAGVVLASAYQFCQQDAKTPDHYFRGFPSYWNVTVLYLLVLHLSPAVNLAIIVLLIILVFVPFKYVYPTRTPHLRTLTLTLAALWGGALMVVVWQLPDPSSWIVAASLLFVAYYVGVSVYLAVRRR